MAMNPDVQFAMRTPLTKEQNADLWRAIYEWQRIRRQERPDDKDPTTVDYAKSCLLGRMTLEGKDPLPFPPPTAYSAPWYSLIEEGRAFLSNEFEKPFPHEDYLLICQCRWQVVEHSAEDEWVIEFPNIGRWGVRHLLASEVAEQHTKGSHRVQNDDGTYSDEWVPMYFDEYDWIIERLEV